MADAVDEDRERRRRGGNCRHRCGYPLRASRPHLRPVLYDLGDRPGHWPGPVRHLGHRPRTRERDALPEGTRAGHALFVAVQAGVDTVGGRGTITARATRQGPGIRNHMRRNASILVIDDEEIMREILEALLTREGYTVRLASTGEEGLELARTGPFDAAIVDVMMPGLNGIQTLDELKKLDEELPVIMITAFASEEN